MKFKIALAVAIMGLSSQASFAATETSCNPYVAGLKCGGKVDASGEFLSHSIAVANTKSGYVKSRGPSTSESRGRSDENLGGVLSEMLKSMRTNVQVLVIDEEVDFGEEQVVVVGPGTDGEGGLESISAVPVPASGLLLLAGLGGLAMARRKKS